MHGGTSLSDQRIGGLKPKDFEALAGRHRIRFVYSTGCWNGGDFVDVRFQESRFMETFRKLGIRSWVSHAGLNSSIFFFLPRFLRELKTGLPVQDAATHAFEYYLQGYDRYHPFTIKEFKSPYASEHPSYVVWGGENLTLDGRVHAPRPALEAPQSPKLLPWPVNPRPDWLSEQLKKNLRGDYQLRSDVNGQQLIDLGLRLLNQLLWQVFPGPQAGISCLPKQALKMLLTATPDAPLFEALDGLQFESLCLRLLGPHRYEFSWSLSPAETGTFAFNGARLQACPRNMEAYGLELGTQGVVQISFAKPGRIETQPIAGVRVLAKIPVITDAVTLKRVVLDLDNTVARAFLGVAGVDFPYRLTIDLKKPDASKAPQGQKAAPDSSSADADACR